MPRIARPRTADHIYELRNRIRAYDQAYYVDHQSLITDTEYDQLFRELQELENANPELADPNSPTRRVGGGVVDGLERHEHAVPMLSIANCMTMEELDAFNQRVVALLGDVPISYAVDYKIDGCAVGLRYEHGALVSAVTRGDGLVGDIITHNARTFRGLPLMLNSNIGIDGVQMPEILEIRGEAYMTNADFAEFKANEELEGREVPANPRNSTAGAIRQLNSEECYRRKIRFVAHGVGHCVPLSAQATTHSVFLDTLMVRGMPCVSGACNLTWDQVKQAITTMIEAMPALGIPVDGIVVKVDRRDQQMMLGATGHHPNWCVAYKWERYEAETTVQGITIQVGKTGALTPVAELAPVEVAETTVSRASLFNKNEIERLDIRIGDVVVVEKAGKIIPHIVRVEKSRRERSLRPYVFPTTCPVCRAVAVQDEGGVAVRCTNTTSCPAQLQAAVEHFCSRKCMDIRGTGPTLVEALIQFDWFYDVSDLYHLAEHSDELLTLPKVGEKKRDKLLAAIEQSKTRAMEHWLAGLNVRHLGLTASRTLARRLGTIWDILAAPRASLLALEGIGTALADSWGAFIDSVRGKQLVARLLASGLDQGSPAQAGTNAGVFADMSIVPTGVFDQFNREEIKDLIIRNGGRASSSVTSKTSFIVAGRSPGGKKIAKAGELNIPIIDLAEFQRRIRANS